MRAPARAALIVRQLRIFILVLTRTYFYDTIILKIRKGDKDMYAFAGLLLVLVLLIGAGWIAFYALIGLVAVIFSIKGIIEDRKE